MFVRMFVVFKGQLSRKEVQPFISVLKIVDFCQCTKNYQNASWLETLKYWLVPV